jgi:hypothetical protein
MVLLTPIVVIFGTLAFTAVLALYISPPFIAVMCVISGDYYWAFAALAAWLLWLRFGRPVGRFAFEGFEHAGM